MRTLRRLIGLIVCGCLSWAGSASADAVVDWNAIAQQATAMGARVAFLDLAVVQTAVHDAVQAIEGRFEPYHVKITGASGSPAAAVAKAAHDVLVALYPDQAADLDKKYHDYLSNNGLAENDPGVGVGQQAAAGILALRANDGSFPPDQQPFTGGTDPGVWRPTNSYIGTPPGPPPPFTPGFAPWLGDVKPFTLNCPAQFRADPPPALESARYRRHYNEVKTLGARFNSARTPEQTDFAYFYAGVLLPQGIRDIANTYVHNISDSARLFALASLAAADALITCWDSKYHYVFWRPITAIQEGDNDGNPGTAGDPDWQPLINTPNYPDYTSGLNNITGAYTRALELFFGTDRIHFSLTSGNPLAVQKTRTYERFSDVSKDMVDARVLEGIHFRFADVAGRRQGRQVAKWVFTHYLRPVVDDDEDDEDEKDHEKNHKRDHEQNHDDDDRED